MKSAICAWCMVLGAWCGGQGLTALPDGGRGGALGDRALPDGGRGGGQGLTALPDGGRGGGQGLTALPKPDWQVFVDGRELPLETVDISIRENNEPAEHKRLKGGWYQFGAWTLPAEGCGGALGDRALPKPVEVRVRCGRRLDHLEILPRKFAVNPVKVSPNEVSFVADKPFRISLCPEGRVGVLHLFANEMRSEGAPLTLPALRSEGAPLTLSALRSEGAPLTLSALRSEGAPLTLPARPRAGAGVGVRRIGPGEYFLTNIVVRSNQTLVIDEGAKVYGHLDVRGTNITVCGTGIISGAKFARHKGPIPFSNAIVNATNVTIRGVTFTDPYTWTIGVRDSRNVLFDNVKVMGGRMINDDGIDVINSSDVTIRDSFVRTQDDNICAKGMGYKGESGRSEGAPLTLPARPRAGAPLTGDPVENLVVEGCELWTDQANNFRIGFECDAAYMRNIRIRDVDVLAASPIALPFTALWCHSVIKAQAGGDLTISGLDVRDLRVHADGNDVCLIYLQPHKTWAPRRGMGRYNYEKCGKIRDCHFENIEVYGKKEGFTGWIYLDGPSPEENVENVTLRNVRYFGEDAIATDSRLKIKGSVSNVHF